MCSVEQEWPRSKGKVKPGASTVGKRNCRKLSLATRDCTLAKQLKQKLNQKSQH
jgi:hypothetical protein